MQKLSITYKEDGLEKTILRDEVQLHHGYFGALNHALQPEQTPDIVKIAIADIIAIAVVEPTENATKEDVKAKVHSDVYKEKVHVVTQHILFGRSERDYVQRELLMPLEKAFYADTAIQEMGILSPTGGFMRVYQKEYIKNPLEQELHDLLSRFRK